MATDREERAKQNKWKAGNACCFRTVLQLQLRPRAGLILSTFATAHYAHARPVADAKF